MRGGNREMRRMLDKMGLEMKDIGNVEEVIIKTDTKELYLVKPQVIEMKGKDSTIFQVVATDIEELLAIFISIFRRNAVPLEER